MWMIAFLASIAVGCYGPMWLAVVLFIAGLCLAAIDVFEIVDDDRHRHLTPSAPRSHLRHRQLDDIARRDRIR